eukprot:364795-Chlamydomonas_euryale.AAC.12
MPSETTPLEQPASFPLYLVQSPLTPSLFHDRHGLRRIQPDGRGSYYGPDERRQTRWECGANMLQSYDAIPTQSPQLDKGQAGEERLSRWMQRLFWGKRRGWDPMLGMDERTAADPLPR